MRFEDSRGWRPGTPSYELLRMRQPAHVPKAIPSHPWSPLPAMRNPYDAKNDSALANRSSRRRGEAPGALAHMVAANLRARALAPVIQELRAAGFVSYGAVARELNRHQVPPLRGGKRWYPMTVSRVLARLAKQRFSFAFEIPTAQGGDRNSASRPLRRLERLDPSSRIAVAANGERLVAN